MSKKKIHNPEEANELIFEQELLKMRVIKTVKGEFDIEVAMLEGSSIGTTEPDEFIAQTITQGLLRAYKAGLKELQDKMLTALTKLSDESKEDELSKGSSDTSDNEHVGT